MNLGRHHHIIDTLILPTEKPPVSVDIKRALLTFDQVNLCAPDDRELVNPINFMTATMPIPMPFAFGGGSPVLPLGKVSRYDDEFAAMLQECDAAVQQGSLVIRRSPELMTQGMTLLGSAPNPEGWAPANWVMRTFRTLVSQREILLAACGGLPSESTLRRLDLDSLAPGGVALTQGFGGPPSIADLNDGSLSSHGQRQRDTEPVGHAGMERRSWGHCSGLCAHWRHRRGRDHIPTAARYIVSSRQSIGRSLRIRLGGLTVRRTN